MREEEPNIYEKSDNVQEDEKGRPEEERVEFDKAPEEEQIKRFKALKSLFAYKGELKDEEAKKRANYYDFFSNVYKYTDRFKISGLTTKKEHDEAFRQAEKGNKLIKAVLDYFLEIKKSQTGVNNYNVLGMDKDGLFVMMPYEGNPFFDIENKQLKVEKLVSLFKWCLGTFADGGKAIGREPPKELKDQIDALSDDLEAILKYVNQFK